MAKVPCIRSNLSDDYLNWDFRNARIRKGLIARELGAMVGVNESAIYRFERYKKMPNENVARQLAEILGLDIDRIYSDKIRQFVKEAYIYRTSLKKVEEKKENEEETARIENLEEEPKDIDAGANLRRLERRLGLVDQGNYMQESDRRLDNEDEETRRERVSQVLDTLTFREREVIMLRYGFYGQKYTYEEIGKRFKTNKQRIKQIEEKAIRKLQHPIRSRRLIDLS